MLRWAVQVPADDHYTLANASVPLCLIEQDEGTLTASSVDQTTLVDIIVKDGLIAAIRTAGLTKAKAARVDCEGRMVWPTFVDLHTHIGEQMLPEMTESQERLTAPGQQEGLVIAFEQQAQSCSNLIHADPAVLSIPRFAYGPVAWSRCRCTA